MERVEREIQKCINRFEFALLIYIESGNGLGLHDIFGIIEELLRDDLLKTFEKHLVAETEKKKEVKKCSIEIE